MMAITVTTIQDLGTLDRPLLVAMHPVEHRSEMRNHQTHQFLSFMSRSSKDDLRYGSPNEQQDDWRQNHDNRDHHEQPAA